MTVFHLNTKQTSYIFGLTRHGKLEHYHYGARVNPLKDYTVLQQKHHFLRGNSVAYQADSPISLDDLAQEYSSVGKGDYNEVACELFTEKSGLVSDFCYRTHRFLTGKVPLQTLPFAHDQDKTCQTLEIELVDEVIDATLVLSYHVFADQDVITRSVRLKNNGTKPISIRRLMSLQLDLPFEQQHLISFNGTWAREFQKSSHRLQPGVLKLDSKSGTSSNRHNPFVMIAAPTCEEQYGSCYGFNLIYSGNHCELADVTPFGRIRFLMGINPHCFSYEVKPDEVFETPEAIMSYSHQGFNQLSQQFHAFINEHIIPPAFKYQPRPILLNNWEATYFNFNEKKLISLAKEAKALGIELFVLDDGWFGKRDDDKSSLGDWSVNKKKLPSGLDGLSEKLKALGLSFGLWLEPEMVSPDSELYQKYPHWAIKVPNRTPSLGRNQLVLDLSKPQVVDYLEETLTRVLSTRHLTYIKWDMNRHISDLYATHLMPAQQGELMHRYQLGLYDLLGRLTKKFPHILFEGCCAGGNRFDLGMLAYMPQIWLSDNTDAADRAQMQLNASYGYPLSTMGAHVSAVSNHQTLRTTCIETRFNVASFGILGYELDVTTLNAFDKKAIKKQIEFYRQHRLLLQFGTLYRQQAYDKNQHCLNVVSADQTTGILLHYQQHQRPNPALDQLKMLGCSTDLTYLMKTRAQFLNIKQFGTLINEVTPIKIKQDGVLHQTISDYYPLTSEVECYVVGGDVLAQIGVRLAPQFGAVGYHEQLRVLGDYGSRLYTFSSLSETTCQID